MRLLLLALAFLSLALSGCGESIRAIGQSDDKRIHAGMPVDDVSAIWGAVISSKALKDGMIRRFYMTESRMEWSALSSAHEHWADFSPSGEVVRWH